MSEFDYTKILDLPIHSYKLLVVVQNSIDPVILKTVRVIALKTSESDCPRKGPRYQLL